MKTNGRRNMTKLGETPKIKYKKDGERYIVYLGDDRIGFVRQYPNTREWAATNTFMDKSRNGFSARANAGAWLKRDFESAVKEGKV